MKINITGASGFIGTNLLAYLQREKDYLINRISLRDGLPAQQITGDVVVHLAGKAHDLKNSTDTQAYFQINTQLTKDIFDAFLKSEAEVFIFISTVKAVIDNPEAIVTEDTPAAPVTDYGKSKYQAEQYILSKLPETSKRVFILRPSMVHGPGNKGNLNLLFKLVNKRIPWPLGAFENERSFCAVDNLIFVISELIQSVDIPSGVYNVCDDKPLSTNELIDLIGQSMHRKARIWKIKSELIQTISKAGDLFRLPLNTERLQKLTESYVVSNHKITEAIGKPLPISSREGLLKTFNSFNLGQ